MPSLILHNVDDAIVQALKQRASQHGISAEAEHHQILKQVLLHPQRKSFADVLSKMPNVGQDKDFERIQDEPAPDVFD